MHFAFICITILDKNNFNSFASDKRIRCDKFLTFLIRRIYKIMLGPLLGRQFRYYSVSFFKDGKRICFFFLISIRNSTNIKDKRIPLRYIVIKLNISKGYPSSTIAQF